MTSDTTTSRDWKFGKNSTALQVIAGHDLAGKYAIVTGSNTGIGLETARALVSAYCHVVLACRDMKKAEDAVEQIKSEYTDGKVEAMRLDLGSLSEVKKFADEYFKKCYPLHYLILNAGIVTDSHQVSVDGYEAVYQTNHLAQMYLAQLLESKLVASAPSRVVLVSSLAIFSVSESALTCAKLDEAFFLGSSDGFDGSASYAQSKCFNVLFARELSNRVKHRGVSCFCVHPGLILTNICSNDTSQKYLHSLSAEFKQSNTKTTKEGAATSVFCAVEKDLEAFSGRFFSDCQVLDVPPWLTEKALSEHLWSVSEALIAKV